MPPKKVPENVRSDAFELPGHAKILAEIGTETSAATVILNQWIQKSPLLVPEFRPTIFAVLSDALRGWPDKEAAAIIRQVHDRLQQGRELDVPSLNRWIRAHPGDAQAVVDCLTVDPPEEISIIQLLSRAGSQKLVFLANWQFAQREVVLKRFIGPDAAARLLRRELQPHPLSMAHPNIIETHLLKNNQGEPFLVERRLPMVLNDDWRSRGVHEAANLLHDIANALAFLREKELVHGDIKPDNIGYENGNYILLDFGICRPFGSFAEDTTPTGSLRTRAPELLLVEENHSYVSDIWALGATIYNAVAGRFPLFDVGEFPPRVSKPEGREAYEAKLANRVRTEWDRRVDPSAIPEPLRELLSRTLKRHPGQRIEAGELVSLCEKELAAFLRAAEGIGRFSPAEQLEQLKAFLPEKRALALMPYRRKHELIALLRRLEGAKGLSDEQKKDTLSLLGRLG